MKSKIELSAFILLIVGTLGLLLNEFAFHWGSAATLVFAAANVLGLVALAYVNWGKRQDA